MQGTLSNKNRTAIFFLTGATSGVWPACAQGTGQRLQPKLA